MIDGITPFDLILVLVIALVIFGPGKLPGLGKALGESIREFRGSISDVKEAVRIGAGTTPVGATAAAPVASTTQAAPTSPAPTSDPAYLLTSFAVASCARAGAAPSGSSMPVRPRARRSR
jgi:TatA/E family protein of Tat protein translocase